MLYVLHLIHCLPIYDVRIFEINPSFLIKLLTLHDLIIFRKKISRWNKKHYSSFLMVFTEGNKTNFFLESDNPALREVSFWNNYFSWDYFLTLNRTWTACARFFSIFLNLFVTSAGPYNICIINLEINIGKLKLWQTWNKVFKNGPRNFVEFSL